MVTELADFSIDPRRPEEFLAAYRGARHLLLDAGAADVSMSRGIESPDRFVMLVAWDSVDQHRVFRAGPAFADWRAAIGEFFTADPRVEHVTPID